MSGTRSEVEKFFYTLLLGDFEEDQSTSAQIVGGLISMVPVLDQVMDARDITGTLFQINRRGGFKQASSDQLVNLGFAGFGAVPAVGSAFKTVFKPIWKERRAAKGAVNGGVEAVEGLLGLKKGAAIRWVREELLGKWPARTNEVILKVQAALAAATELCEFLANAGGWQDWLIPDSIQALAKEMLSGMRQLRDQIRAPLERASREIQEFLEDLLGEQAAAMVMASGQKAVAASVLVATRTRNGHNHADPEPRGKVPPRQKRTKVAASDKTSSRKGAGAVHAAVRVSRNTFKKMATREKGLIGEHIVDYHEAQRLGGSWPHDDPNGAWAPAHVCKVDGERRPIHLRLADLAKINQPGFDSVWQHGEKITIVEAKTRESIFAAIALGRYLEKKGVMPVVPGLNRDEDLLHSLLSDYSDKGNGQGAMVQMSKAWVRSRLQKADDIDDVVRDRIEQRRYLRRVALVTLESRGAMDHVQALVDIHLGKPSHEVHPHEEHGVTQAWAGAEIDKIDKARERARPPGKPPSPERPDEPSKPTKARKNKRNPN